MRYLQQQFLTLTLSFMFKNISAKGMKRIKRRNYKLWKDFNQIYFNYVGPENIVNPGKYKVKTKLFYLKQESRQQRQCGFSSKFFRICCNFCWFFFSHELLINCYLVSLDTRQQLTGKGFNVCLVNNNVQMCRFSFQTRLICYKII